MQPGKFITLEGSEGTGKSTNIGYVKAYLEQRGIQVVMTREPGGTALGEAIRSLILGDHLIVSEAELLLLFAARAQHVKQVIAPAMQEGFWVISDRFTEATHAYQGGGRGIETEIINQLEHWVLKGLQPDLTLLLDVSPEIGMERIKSRGFRDRFEREDRAFFERVRARYLARAETSNGRIQVVDATQPLIDVQSIIAGHLNRLIAS
ncbi:MAG: dTMP kinase [Methylococcaceae bacterium]